MSPPVFVTFRRMAPRPELEAYAREQASQLARRYSGIAEWRVVLEPNEAGLLRVTIDLSVPGERLVATHESEPADAGDAEPDAELQPVPEYRWLHGLHGAFEAVDRLLQEHAGRRLARAHVRG